MSLLLSMSLFFMDDQPVHAVFDFNDMCSMDFSANITFVCGTSAGDTSTAPLN